MYRSNIILGIVGAMVIGTAIDLGIKTAVAHWWWNR